MSSSLRLCGALALLLLSLAPGCRKESERQDVPTPAAVTPPPVVPAPPVLEPVEVEPLPPPSREDALACEALMDLRTLLAGQVSVFNEKSAYTAEPALLPTLPACEDGTRAPVPDETWIAGCRFRYRATTTSGIVESTFTVQVIGVGAAEGREYTMSSGHEDARRVWPAALTPDVCGSALAPSVCEAAVNLRALFTAEKAFFQE